MAINAGPKFWANIQSEPKRKYRFVLNLGGLDHWVITRVTRPSFTVTETEHAYYNHKFYYPGRVEWQTVSFSLVDPIHPDATGYIMGVLGACGYRFPAAGQFKSISKQLAVEALKEPRIRAKNANGDDVEVWTLKNAWVKNATMDSFEYSSDDMLTMEIELRYDYATYESKSGGGAALPPDAAINNGYAALKPGTSS